MKNKSMDNIITDELVAAFLEGNATAAQCQMILDSLAYDEDLRELLAECIAVDEDLAAMNSLKIARERARSRARVARVGARANARVRATSRTRAVLDRTGASKKAGVSKIAELVTKGVTATDAAAPRRAKKKLAAGTAARTASRSAAGPATRTASRTGTATRSGAGSRRNRMS